MRKQDSPHEGFCSPSQTPYSPAGKAEFNVARAEHPVLQKTTKNKTQPSHFSHCYLCMPSGPHTTEPYTCTVYTLADRKYAHTNRHTYLLFIHASVIQKTDCKDINSKEIESRSRMWRVWGCCITPTHIPFLGGYDSHGRIQAISLQNTHTHKQFHTPAVQWWWAPGRAEWHYFGLLSSLPLQRRETWEEQITHQCVLKCFCCVR